MFPGITGFGISDPENKAVAIPVQEFISFGGFGGGIKAAELEFLNLLHIVFKLITIYYRIKRQKIQKNLQKNCLRRDYTLCEGYTVEYVSEKTDERHFYIDPDKYRNPEVRKALELPEGGVGVFYPVMYS